MALRDQRPQLSDGLLVAAWAKYKLDQRLRSPRSRGLRTSAAARVIDGLVDQSQPQK